MRIIAILVITVLGVIIMSVHDTGTGDNRTNAMPASHDVATGRKADGTQGITQKVNENSGAYVSTKDAAVTVNDGDYNVITLGRFDDGSYGLKIAKPGFDANTASNDDLILNSSQNTLKIIATDLITFPSIPAAAAGVAGGTDVDIDTGIVHDGSTAYGVIGFLYLTYQGFPMPYVSYSTSTAAPVTWKIGINSYSSPITGTIMVQFTGLNYSASPTASYELRYYLLQESVN